MKYRGINNLNGNFVYGFYFVDNGIHKIHSGHTIYPVGEMSVSLFFGKKDKNGKEIYTNDKVKYKGKEYEVRYFEEYGAFGLMDILSGLMYSKGMFFTDNLAKQMEVI